MNTVEGVYKIKTVMHSGWIKGLLGILLVLGLSYHLLHIKSWQEWVASYRVLAPSIDYIPIVIALILSIPNWVFESIKWKIGVESTIKMSQRQALVTILRGVTGASITPARVGEYAGRIYEFDSAEERWASISSTFIGSVAQNVVTIYFGVLGISYILLRGETSMIYRDYALLILAIVSIVALLCMFFMAERVMRYALSIIPVKSWREWTQFIKQVPSRNKKSILIFAALRYGVYVLQYALIATAFGIPVMSIEAISVIVSVLCIQSLIPLPATVAMIARAEIALWLWGILGAGELNILFTTYTLWAINILLPALVGYTTLWSVKRSSPTEQMDGIT